MKPSRTAPPDPPVDFAGAANGTESPVTDRIEEFADELSTLGRIRLDLFRESVRSTGRRGLDWLWVVLGLATLTVTSVVLVLQGLVAWVAASVPGGVGSARVVVGLAAILVMVAGVNLARAIATRRRVAELTCKYEKPERENSS